MNHTHNMLRFLRLKLDQVAHRINRAGMSDSPILRQARRKPDCVGGWISCAAPSVGREVYIRPSGARQRLDVCLGKRPSPAAGW